jgi:hypothetical protein
MDLEMTRDNETSKDAIRAYESVRKIAEMWGIGRDQFVGDWESHVHGEKTGLEREPAFSTRRTRE